MNEFLTYKNIVSDIANFKRSGTRSGSDFNIYDTPTNKYFKLLFYFGSNSEFDSDNGSGLLAPTWDAIVDKSSHLEYYNHNSAWAYLKLNDENERAEKLEQFVTLLSDINTLSPWYFSKIGGLQEALERKVTEDGKLEIADKKLTITCLPDAFDNRIGTLLELYRDVTWSWVHKKEMIPANLRKFDMAVYIFETPERTWHDDNSTMINGATNISTDVISYKMIEFHDCEFNYNSVKSAWSDIDNATGIQPTYTIDITYSDCYEISYNDIMMRTIGDVIMTDLLNDVANPDLYISKPQEDNNSNQSNIKLKTNAYQTGNGFGYITDEEKNNEVYEKSKTYTRFGNIFERHERGGSLGKAENKAMYQPGFIENAVGQLVGGATKMATDWVKQKIMGNIFGFSLTSLASDAKSLLQGNLVKTGMTIGQYAREQKNKKRNKELSNSKPTGNIFKDSTIANNL